MQKATSFTSIFNIAEFIIKITDNFKFSILFPRYLSFNRSRLISWSSLYKKTTIRPIISVLSSSYQLTKKKSQDLCINKYSLYGSSCKPIYKILKKIVGKRKHLSSNFLYSINSITWSAAMMQMELYHLYNLQQARMKWLSQPRPFSTKEPIGMKLLNVNTQANPNSTWTKFHLRHLFPHNQLNPNHIIAIKFQEIPK